MRTIIKLIIVALILHATWRAGEVYLRYYRFRDSVRQTAQFSGRRSDSELRKQVLEFADAFDIPLDPRRVAVRRIDNHTLINASYDERIEILPRYHYPWEFKVNVDAYNLTLKEAQP